MAGVAGVTMSSMTVVIETAPRLERVVACCIYHAGVYAEVVMQFGSGVPQGGADHAACGTEHIACKTAHIAAACAAFMHDGLAALVVRPAFMTGALQSSCRCAISNNHACSACVALPVLGCHSKL